MNLAAINDPIAPIADAAITLPTPSIVISPPPARDAETGDRLFNAISTRRSFSLKEVSPDPINLVLVAQMLEAANWAPSHGQTEPWRFVVYSGDARRIIGDAFGVAYRHINQDRSYAEAGERAQRERVWQAPVWIALGMQPNPKMPEWEELIAFGSAVQNMQLMAGALGLASKWTSGVCALHPRVAEVLGQAAADRLMGCASPARGRGGRFCAGDAALRLPIRGSTGRALAGRQTPRPGRKGTLGQRRLRRHSMTATTTLSSAPLRYLRSRPILLAGLLMGVGLLLLAMLMSIAFGAADIAPADVWDAFFAFDPSSTNHLIIRTLRAPRAVVAVLVGAALAVAGAVMQGLTRNPLADTGLLGIETGAALGVVAAVYFLGVNSLAVYALFAFAGAALTAVVVYTLGSLGRGGPTPLKLTIAGAALTALLSSLTTGMLLFNQRTLEEVRFWLAGSIAGRDLGLLLQASPYLLAGLVLALALGRQITTLSLGEDVAKGLGQQTGAVKGLAAAAVVLLAGASTAVAGPIGFVGLVIPHIVRFIVGVDYRWVLPYAALLGAIFLVISDVAARLVLRPIELPVGVMTALIGGPFFIWLVRWRVKK